MKFRKTLLLSVFAGALLSACQAPNNNVIPLTTPAPTAMFNTQNQTAVVNVMTQDLRNSREVSNYTQNGNVIRFVSMPEVGQAFQQLMQQNLNSKGFAVVQGAGNANVTMNVRKFFANVESGNFRHKVAADISLEVHVQGARGQFSKNFNSSRTKEGALGVNATDISEVLNAAYTDVVQAIYNDNEITNAIHQFK